MKMFVNNGNNNDKVSGTVNEFALSYYVHTNVSLFFIFRFIMIITLTILKYLSYY